GPEVTVPLRRMVWGVAEADLGKGYRIKLAGTRGRMGAIRAQGAAGGGGYRPRLVFASSVAVFGAPLPEPVPEDHALTPLTSYGTQKAICELLLADYTRRGILDGIGIRLPTICVRPGRPNKAASGFFSSIIREPLVGEEAVLPVSEDVRHWHASPRAAVGFLVHAATLEGEAVGPRRTLDMPGVSVSVGEQIAALRRVAGNAAVARIRREPDAGIARIIAGWPRAFAPARAHALGFRAEESFDAIIRVHIEDELGGRVPG
ncbi:MAG: NAD-dependent epimerase/dehydratase family protein, partial [Salinarimonas sp.]